MVTKGESGLLPTTIRLGRLAICAFVSCTCLMATCVLGGVVRLRRSTHTSPISSAKAGSKNDIGASICILITRFFAGFG